MTKSINKTNNLKKASQGFVAGTLVHTKEGLVPIEQIKVGDYVLSKPENGEGEQAYKSVTQTFAHPPKRIIKVRYLLEETPNIAHPIHATVNHPFWAVGKGWTAAEDLKGRWAGDDKFELSDGRQAVVYGNSNIYVSDQLGVGWTSRQALGETSLPGDLWDYLSHRLVSTDAPPT